MKNSKIERYKSALELLFYEGQIAWQMNILFIGLNVGIGTVFGGLSVNEKFNHLTLGLLSLAGLIINVAWLGTFRRNNKYYNFRMAQAREVEPRKWRLVRDRGYRFSKGREIELKESPLEPNDKIHQLNGFEKFFTNKKAIGISIGLFIAGFIFLFIWSTVRLFYTF